MKKCPKCGIKLKTVIIYKYGNLEEEKLSFHKDILASKLWIDVKLNKHLQNDIDIKGYCNLCGAPSELIALDNL